MNTLAHLIVIITSIYVNLILLRFFLQYFKADFYNPLSQFVVKATNPLLKPLRKITPGFGGLDVASLVLAWLVFFVSSFIIILLAKNATNIDVFRLLQIPRFELNIFQLLVLPFFKIINNCFHLFIILIIVTALFSWIPNMGYNPIVQLFRQITEPLVARFRKFLPVNSGFDFSPIIAILVLWVINSLIVEYLLPMINYL